jgi:hypothetical protein
LDGRTWLLIAAVTTAAWDVVTLDKHIRHRVI